MQLNEKKRRRRLLNLTPLIDVVFLLLVFFMLASTFLKFGTVKIDTAGTGGGKADLSKTVLIHVAPERRYRVSGRAVRETELSGALGGLISQGRTDAVIVMQRDTTVDDLVAGLTRVRRAGFATVRVVN